MIGEDNVARLNRLISYNPSPLSDSFVRRADEISEAIVQEVRQGKRNLDISLTDKYKCLAEKIGEKSHVYYAVLERMNWLDAKVEYKRKMEKAGSLEKIK